MANHHVIASPLKFGAKLHEGLGGFEENFNTPSIPINTDDFRVGQGQIGTEYRQPISFIITISDKNQFNRDPIFRFTMMDPNWLPGVCSGKSCRS